MRPAVPLITALLPAGVLLLAACGPPPELPQTPAPVPPVDATSPTTPVPSGSPGSPGPPPPGPPGSAGPPPNAGGFPEEIALDCAGRPGGDELLAVLHSEGIMDPAASAEIVEGPFCSGRWQYAVISMPDRDPLQVVTRGEPGQLELITAGTDVCTVEVRIQSPPGIQGATACVP